MPDEPARLDVQDALLSELDGSDAPECLDVPNEPSSPDELVDTFADITLPCLGRVGNATKAHLFDNSIVRPDATPYCRDNPFRWQPSELGCDCLSGFSLCDSCLRACPLRRARAVRAYAVF